MIRKHHAIYLCLLVAGFTLGMMLGLERWATGPTQALTSSWDERYPRPITAERHIGPPWEQGYHPFQPPPWIEQRLKHEVLK